MDGVGGITQNNIKPGESFTYAFNLDDEGTYMYHAHVDSLDQVNNDNLYGGLVVESTTQPNSDMLIYNTNVEDINQHHSANQTFDQVLVNAQEKQSLYLNNDQDLYLNIVNLASTPLSINFGKDIEYKILSIDANDAISDWQVNNSVIVPTAQRFIVQIKNPKHSFQISTSLKTKDNAVYNVYYKNDKDIQTQDFSGQVSGSMMSNVEYEDVADDSKVDKRFDMSLDMNMGMWTINDKAFPKTKTVNVDEGDVVEITLSNNSHMAETHPFHLHGHKFQVVKVNGQELNKILVLDTIDVIPGNTVTIRFNADNPGIWAFHCHNLVHAKLGMMTTLNYNGYTTNVESSVSE